MSGKVVNIECEHLRLACMKARRIVLTSPSLSEIQGQVGYIHRFNQHAISCKNPECVALWKDMKNASMPEK